jgi:hypothetical protein
LGVAFDRSGSRGADRDCAKSGSLCRLHESGIGHFLTLAVATKIDNNPTLELSIGYPITHPVASVIV